MAMLVGALVYLGVARDALCLAIFGSLGLPCLTGGR